MYKLIITVILVCISFLAFGQTRKVLFIGIDGCRWDALMTANAPAIDNLLANSIYSGNGLTEYKTWSGTGWSGMLTGVWNNKHGVSDNSFSGAMYNLYPDFISRAESHNPELKTISVVHWAPINTTIIQAIDNKISVATDSAVRNSAVNILNNDNPDILFVAFDDVDHAGHTHGFGTSIPEYIQSIETTDNYVGDILTALYNRTNYANEDWLIILTTDHGGTAEGHGGGTLEERTIFNIYNNPSFGSQTIHRNLVRNIATHHEAHFPAGTYATPINQSDFEFGASQDFTIELWVKANSYSDDPAFISNKDWDSGLNAGFVISAQQGQYWKVNIGDGTHRMDIHGGFIKPNEWHHLAVSFDRNGLMTAYEDGVVVGFDSMLNINNIHSGLPLVINQDGTTNYGYDFDGSIKDIRIWNTVIPNDALVQWATIPVTASHPYFSNLLANWKCEDGSGTSLQDASPHGNHCNVTNALEWNLTQTDTFTVFDYAETPREPDNAVTALTWMCIPIQSSWNLDGKSWVAPCMTTGSTTFHHDSGFSIQPNPSSDVIMATFKQPFREKAILQVFDLEGRRIKQIGLPENQTSAQISVKELAAGLYYLRISGASFDSTVKFIKK